MSLPEGEGLREQARRQLLAALGGWSGTVAAAIPPVVFVVVNALASLRSAIVAALASGGLVALYRMVRREPLQQAITGLFTVAVAAAIAARTGQARGYFLVGIAAAVGYAVIFASSLLLRRPLVGVLWEFLDPTPLPERTSWRKVPTLFRAYSIATGAALIMFAARAVVQLRLFQDNRTGWLAVAKLAMGYPLYIAVVALCFWVIRRARHRIVASDPAPDTGERKPTDTERKPTDTERMLPAEGSGGTDRPTDGGLGFGQGHE